MKMEHLIFTLRVNSCTTFQDGFAAEAVLRIQDNNGQVIDLAVKAPCVLNPITSLIDPILPSRSEGCSTLNLRVLNTGHSCQTRSTMCALEGKQTAT